MKIGIKNFLNRAISKKNVINAARKGAKFIGNQLKHPAAQRFMGDVSRIATNAVNNEDDPRHAVNMISSRAKQEASDTWNRTKNHLRNRGISEVQNAYNNANFDDMGLGMAMR